MAFSNSDAAGLKHIAVNEEVTAFQLYNFHYAACTKGKLSNKSLLSKHGLKKYISQALIYPYYTDPDEFVKVNLYNVVNCTQVKHTSSNEEMEDVIKWITKSSLSMCPNFLPVPWQ